MTMTPAARRRGWMLAAAFLVPSAVIFAVFTYFPFALNFKLAMYSTSPYPGVPDTFVGLSQFGDVLRDSTFIQSLVSTVLFVLMVVPTGLLLGLALAVAANKALRGMAFFRVVFSSTVVTSVAVGALIFGTLMNPIVGFLPWLGIDPKPPLLQSPTWALPAVAVIAVWQFLGLSFIIMSAGLQSLPEEVLEASRVDGAGTWTTFWRVTVPMLSPTLFFGLVVGTIYAFQTFGQIDILIGQQNAEQYHVNVLLYYIYQLLGGTAPDQGRAAVVSLVLFVILLGLTLLQLRVVERRVHYAAR